MSEPQSQNWSSKKWFGETSVIGYMIDVCILCWRVPKGKHSNKAITYQYKSKHVFKQYGCHDCLVDSLVVVHVKITQFGSPRFEQPYCDFQSLQNCDSLLKFIYCTIQICFHSLHLLIAATSKFQGVVRTLSLPYTIHKLPPTNFCLQTCVIILFPHDTHSLLAHE